MTVVTKIDANTCDLIRAKLNDALADVAKELGLDIDIGNIRYNPESFTTKLEVKLAGADDKKMKALKARAGLYGVTLDPCTYAGETVQLTGYNTRARKNSFHFTFLTGKDAGKNYVCDERFAKTFFKK